MGTGLKRSIYIGWDPRETRAWSVAMSSLTRRLSDSIPAHALALPDLTVRGLYSRPTERRGGRLWDVISDAPMSTEHANARFLTPHLARSGWALFMDGDMLVRGNVGKLFETLNSKYAVYCVKHRHEPLAATKMDGQAQTRYARKNWSSFLIFNCEHPANAALTVELVNTLPGRDLHALCWLKDEQIGELAPEWNFLVGHSDPTIDPKVVHFTSGTPDMAGYENQPHADAWRSALIAWARGG